MCTAVCIEMNFCRNSLKLSHYACAFGFVTMITSSAIGLDGNTYTHTHMHRSATVNLSTN